LESPDEVVDLLAKGQGVFAIAVDKVWTDLEGSLAKTARKKTRGTAAGGA
jgi:hypothetical protein